MHSMMVLPFEPSPCRYCSKNSYIELWLFSGYQNLIQGRELRMKYCGNQSTFTIGMGKKGSAVKQVYVAKVLMPRDQESNIL